MRLLSDMSKYGESVSEYTYLPDAFFDRAAPESAVSLTDADIQAKELLKQARIQADKILSDTRSQCEMLREHAYKEGKAEGYAAGKQQAFEEYTEEWNKNISAFRNETAHAIEDITRAKERMLEKYNDDLKQLTITIAEKIIHISLESSGEVIRRMITDATDKLKKRQWAKIYIAKCDTELSIKADSEFLAALARLSDNVKVVAMDSAEAGTCIIELPDAIIDASVTTQIENIKGILNNAKG